jgi:chromosomal replication initiator protein
MNILNLTSEEFMHEYVQATKDRRLQQLVNKFRKNCDVLLIDDIQFLSNWPGTQTQFFHIFNHLIDAEKQIVMTSDRYPHEIPDIEDRLRSRFEWGLIVAIDPPNLNTRINIIKDKAKRYNINITDDVVNFLAFNLKSNIREIEGILRKLKLYSLTKKKISVDTVEDILRKHMKLNQKQLSIDIIKKKVSNFYDIPIEDLVSTKRQKAITTARQIAMYIAKKITSETLENIGKGFTRDHSTVVNSINKVDKLIEEDIKISKDVKELMRLLTE